MERSYVLEKPEEPAMSWAEYEAIVLQEWHDFLDRPSCDEADLQAFFERHPCMVPGAPGPRGQHPEGSVLISQPPLPA